MQEPIQCLHKEQTASVCELILKECTQDHWGCCERHPKFVSVRISALGLFTGAWVREAVGRELANIPWLSKDSGLAAFQLTTSATSTEGLHDVEVASCVTLHHLATLRNVCLEQTLSIKRLWY